MNNENEWREVGPGTPTNVWLETKNSVLFAENEKTTETFCRIIEIGGEPEWIWRDGTTTVTHHSLSAPTHWRWLTEPVYTHNNLIAALKCRENEWGKGKDTGIAFAGLEVAGEIGEAIEKAFDLITLAIAGGRMANVVKKLERERMEMPGSRATQQELADELGDVVISAARVAMKQKIHFEKAVKNKFNKTSIKLGFKTRMG
jgi:NTP pyrophosphatase (non-canonical NTP hydrolase)